MDTNAAYVVAGYALTAVALCGHVLRLQARASAARRRADGIAARRRSDEHPAPPGARHSS